jgi:hypothetical protein
MDVVGSHEGAYYICAKCSRPTNGHFVIQFPELDLNGEWNVAGNKNKAKGAID